MTKRTVGGIFLVSVLVLSGTLLFRYYQNYRSLIELTKPTSGFEIVSSIQYTPSFPTPFAQVDGKGVWVVSTGKISNLMLKDHQSSEALGEASVLEMVTRDNRKRVEKMRFILQLSSISDPRRNLIPWVVSQASQLRSLAKPPGDALLSRDKLAQLFPEGSQWIFVPFLEPDSEAVLESLPEYRFYAQRYYGNDLDNIRSFIEADLLGSYKDPILVLDIFHFSKQ